MNDSGEILLNNAFILYAKCTVLYKGRAKSRLISGNYLIIRKNDGSIQIHGASKSIPLNYQSIGATLEMTENKLTSKRKNEILEIEIEEIHHYFELNNWSNNQIDILGTEEQLRQKIVTNIDDILECHITKVIIEYKTKYGSIDIVAIDENNIYHVIEVKRAKASIITCTQLERYLSCLTDENILICGWIMSPEISYMAKEYCEKHHLKWKKVIHDKL